MRCEAFLDRWDRLDAGEALPATLRRHLADCPSCALLLEREAAALAEARAAAELLPARPALLDERIMAAVRLTPHPRREMAMGSWLLSGSLLVLATALIPLGMDIDWIKGSLGRGWELPLALVLGTGFAAYGALFIVSHLEELLPLVKRMGGVHRA